MRWRRRSESDRIQSVSRIYFVRVTEMGSVMENAIVVENTPPFPIQKRKDINIEGVVLTPDDLNTIVKIIDSANKEAQVLQKKYENTEQFSSEDHLTKEIEKFFRVSHKANFGPTDSVEGYDYIDFSSDAAQGELTGLWVTNRDAFNKAASGRNPANCVDIWLDFTRPSLAFDFINLPSNPTSNGSVINIYGFDETWVMALYQRLNGFLSFRERRMKFLHVSGAYDIFLYAFAVPIFTFYAYRIENNIDINFENKSLILQIVIYFYTIFIFFNICRFIFLYFRWLFPLVEYSGGRGFKHPKVHRVIFVGLVLSLLGAVVYDSIKWAMAGLMS